MRKILHLLVAAHLWANAESPLGIQVPRPENAAFQVARIATARHEFAVFPPQVSPELLRVSGTDRPRTARTVAVPETKLTIP